MLRQWVIIVWGLSWGLMMMSKKYYYFCAYHFGSEVSHGYGNIEIGTNNKVDTYEAYMEIADYIRTNYRQNQTVLILNLVPVKKKRKKK